MWLKLTIVVVVLGYVTLAMALVLDGLLTEHLGLRRALGTSPGATLPPQFSAGINAMLGAVLGAGALSLVSFHKYAGVEQSFAPAHAWGYFIAPWLAAVLGLMVYALLQTGLLVFAPADGGDAKPVTGNLGYLATGFLSGFGWYDVTERLRQLVARLFCNKEPDGRTTTQRIQQEGNDTEGGAVSPAPPSEAR